MFIETRSSSVGSLGRSKSQSRPTQDQASHRKSLSNSGKTYSLNRASSNPKLGGSRASAANASNNGIKKAVAAMHATSLPPDTLSGVGIESLVKVLGILEDDFRKLKR